MISNHTLVIAKGVVRFDDDGNRLSPVVLLQQFRMNQSEFVVIIEEAS